MLSAAHLPQVRAEQTFAQLRTGLTHIDTTWHCDTCRHYLTLWHMSTLLDTVTRVDTTWHCDTCRVSTLLDTVTRVGTTWQSNTCRHYLALWHVSRVDTTWHCDTCRHYLTLWLITLTLWHTSTPLYTFLPVSRPDATETLALWVFSCVQAGRDGNVSVAGFLLCPGRTRRKR